MQDAIVSCFFALCIVRGRFYNFLETTFVMELTFYGYGHVLLKVWNIFLQNSL